MRLSVLWPVLVQTWNDWLEDKASRLAASLAYYTVISLAPLLVLSVTILKFLHLDGRRVVEDQMAVVMGETGRAAAAMMIEAAREQSGFWPTVISFAILIFAASGVFAELQDSMNVIWEVQPRPDAGWIETIKKRFLSMTMVFGVAFLMVVSLILSTLLGAVATRIAGEGVVVGYALDILLSLFVYTVVFTLILCYLPDVTVRFRDGWIGAVVTAVLFTIGKYLLTLYLTKGSTASAYGAAGSLAALLIWVYYSAQILFFGAEFTKVYVHRFGQRVVPERGAVPITEEQRAQQGMVREHDLTAAAQAEDALTDKHGGVWGADATRDHPHTVTITRPQPRTPYAVAMLGLAGGIVVGAIGLLHGRRFIDRGAAQIDLNDRLNGLESRLQRRRQARNDLLAEKRLALRRFLA